MAYCNLVPLYNTLAKTAITDEAVAAIILIFLATWTNNKNKHLWCYIVDLMDNLELLQFSHLKKHNLILIILVVRFLRLVCAINEQFNNFLSNRQVQIIYTILEEEKIHLHATIRATLERINTILQKQIFLLALEKKMGRILQMIIKVAKDLDAE